MIKYNDKIMKDIRYYLNNTENINRIIEAYEHGLITLPEVADIVFHKDNN